jgi:hypothetical protein
MPYWSVLPGYALTVHKAQGMTLSGVIVEEDVFWSIAPTRLPYVALSRVSNGCDVSLNGFSGLTTGHILTKLNLNLGACRTFNF